MAMFALYSTIISTSDAALLATLTPYYYEYPEYSLRSNRVIVGDSQKYSISISRDLHS